MLNSRYAPTVALTALLILIVGALGYFLAIKPKASDTISLVDRESAVRANIAVIEADSAELDTMSQALRDAPELTDAITLNAPTRDGLFDFMNRVSLTVIDSKVEISELSVGEVVPVDGWTVPAALRPSSAVAQNFAAGPLPRQPGEPGGNVVYAPVVALPVDGVPAVTDLLSVSVSVVVKGRPEETVDFVRRLTSPDSRIFIVRSVTQEAKQEEDARLAGVSEFTNGDVLTTIEGTLFMLGAEDEVLDEDALGSFVVPLPDSPFQYPEAIDPQPGAK